MGESGREAAGGEGTRGEGIRKEGMRGGEEQTVGGSVEHHEARIDHDLLAAAPERHREGMAAEAVKRLVDVHFELAGLVQRPSGRQARNAAANDGHLGALWL